MEHRPHILASWNVGLAAKRRLSVEPSPQCVDRKTSLYKIYFKEQMAEQTGTLEFNTSGDYTSVDMPKATAPPSNILREFIAEVIGTFVLVAFGTGVVAQTVCSSGMTSSITNIHICWGLAVTFGIYAAGGVSGAHINPAVTLSLAVFKRFEWKKVPVYVAAQFIGAFLAAFVTYVVYVPHITLDSEMVEKYGSRATPAIPYAVSATIFKTGMASNMNLFSSFISEMVGSIFLMFGIMSIVDEKNMGAPDSVKPAAIGLLVVAIGMAFGMNTGYAINPARDFGPRLFACFAGYEDMLMSRGLVYFWVPLLAPCVGCIMGAGLYIFGIEQFHPKQNE